MKQTKLKRFKRILLTIVFIIIAVTCCSTNKCAHPIVDTQDTLIVSDTIKIDSIEIVKDSIREELVLEVQKYLNRQSPKAHKFIPKYLVIAGLNNDIDICFMMAQTQLETNFGTAGAGRESSRRSLFGVSIRKYSDYESAISDYCSLLKRSYLVKGKTEQHLMTKYVTIKGGRYATNPNYEKELKTTYKNIVSKTKITELQNKWKEFNEEKDNET